MREFREAVAVPFSLFDALPGLVVMRIWPRSSARGQYFPVTAIAIEARIPEAVRHRLALHPATQKTPQEHERENVLDWPVGAKVHAGAYGIVAGGIALLAALLVSGVMGSWPLWAVFLSAAAVGLAVYGVAYFLEARAEKAVRGRCREHDALLDEYAAAMVRIDDPQFGELFEPLSQGMRELHWDLGPELSSALADALVAFMEWRQAEAGTRAELRDAEWIVSRTHGDEAPEVVAVRDRLEELQRERWQQCGNVERLRDVVLEGLGDRKEELRARRAERDRQLARMEARAFLESMRDT